MKRSTANGLILVGSIIIGIGLGTYFYPIRIDQNETWHVGAYSEWMANTYLDNGKREEGYFTVRGGNEQIDFYVRDPYGAIIYDAGTVTGRRDFAFTAESAGAYTVYFENYEAVTKTVYFTVKRYAANMGLTIAAVGCLVMLACLIGIVQDRARTRRAETQKTKQSSPQQWSITLSQSLSPA